MSSAASLESAVVPVPSVIIEPQRRMFDIDFAELWNYRELIYFMVWRDVKSRYKQTILGFAWAVIQPLMTMTVFFVIFSLFARVPSDGVPYPLFAFVGLLPWTYFAQATARASGGLVGNSGLVAKVYFPRLILPLSAAITPVFDFLLSFVVLIGMMVWYHAVPTIAVLALPALLLLAFFTALGVGLWLSALHVKYRDIAMLVPFVLQVWMYASPVIYPLTMVPARVRTIYSINPMVGVITGFRWALTGGPAPNLAAGAASLIAVAVLVVSGLWFFRRAEREFADLI